MAAPTVTYGGNSNATDSVGTTETITSVTWAAGDTILVLGMTEDQGKTIATPAATGLTFSALTGLPTTTGSSCKGYGWSAVAASGATANITATTTASTTAVIAAWVITAATTTGLGTPATTTSNTKTNSLVRAGNNSAVAWIAGDWSADADVTVTASPAGGTQRIAATNGQATIFAFSWADEGAAATTSYGVANASGTGTLTKIAVEIKGTVSGGATVRTLGTVGVGV